MNRKPNALSSIGEEIALYGAYAMILIAPLVFWGMT